MNNALPTTDATGKVRLTAGEYFDFTLSGTINGIRKYQLGNSSRGCNNRY